MDQNQNENIVKDTETPTADTFLNEEMPKPKTGRARDTLFSRAVFAAQDWLAEYGYLLIGALIPVVLMYLLYLAKEIYPFGDGCVLVLDLNGQYSAFYHGLRDVLKGDASLLYTFCRNMGGEFLGIFDYYVASPFAWLIALFPETRMLEALLVLFLLKTGLLGFNMGFYLHKISKGNPNRLAVVIISILYALCTYAVVQQHNSMWIDAMLWLPILTYAIEELIKYGKFRLYAFVLALTLFSNFYIGYMVCIYTVAYCFYWYFAHNQNNENNPTGEKNHFTRSVGRVILWSLLAAGMASLAILSARYSLAFGKDEFSNPSWAVEQRFDLIELLYKLLPSSYDTVRPAGLPFIYCGTLTLLLVPAFFLCKKFSDREKIAAGCFILFFVVSFATSTIDLIWHGFQKPNWLNYRYSFMLCFFLLVLAYRAFCEIRYVSRKSLLAVTAAWALIILVIQKMGDYLTEQNEYIKIRPFATIWLALGCLAVYYVLISVQASDFRSRETVGIILAFFVCVETFLSGLSEMNAFDKDVTYSKYSRYNDFLKTFLPISETIRENDDGFYRTEKIYHRKTNDNFSLKFKGLSCSTSTLNRDTIDFLGTMGYAGTSHWSKYCGGNPVSDSIMGIKYLVSDDKVNVDYYGNALYPNDTFEYDEDLTPVNNPDVYLNPYALSLVFGVSEAYDTFDVYGLDDDGDKDWIFDTPMDQLNALVTAMLGEDELIEIFKTVPQTVETKDAKCVNCDYSTIAGHHKWVITNTADKATVTINYEVPTDKELFVFFPSDYPREVTLKVNGTSKGGFYGSSESSYRRIASIGKSTSTSLTLEMTIKNSSNNLYIKQSGDLHPYDSYVYYIDWDVFTEVFPRLQAMNMQIDPESTDDHIFGTVTTQEAVQTMATTIAWDEGWNVFVDGEKVDIFKTSDALIAFHIDGAGEHTIEMKYMPAVVRLGIICSIVCTVVFILLCILYPLLKKIPLLKVVFAVPGEDLPPVESAEERKGLEPGDLGEPGAFTEPVDHTVPSNADEKPFRIPPKKPASDGKPADKDSAVKKQNSRISKKK
ncbi:MAG: YfhO family protein [Clostridia bacterium]|nr:YfhO family protein [Clostridia bacterium]